MTFEAAVCDEAILRRISELLNEALAEAGAVLAADVPDPALAWRATVPFIPLLRLLKDSLAVRGTDASPQAVPSAPDRLEGRSLSIFEEQIEADFLSRGSPASNVIPMLRRR